MREIELKFKVDSLDNIIDFLKKEGCIISDVLDQKDTVYVSNINDTESREESVWLRVRQENDKIELNYKKQGNKKMTSKEIEFQVDSSDKAKCFLEELGFVKWVEVHKRRITTKYKEYNICMDQVERLGNFIEIEILVPDDNDKDYEEELYLVAEELGINRNNRINSHYDTMIRELDK